MFDTFMTRLFMTCLRQFYGRCSRNFRLATLSARTPESPGSLVHGRIDPFGKFSANGRYLRFEATSRIDVKGAYGGQLGNDRNACHSPSFPRGAPWLNEL